MSSLAEFSRSHQAARTPASSRVIAVALTAGLYGLLLFMAGHRTTWAKPRPPLREIYTSVMPVVKEEKPLPRLPRFVAHLIKPPVQAISPPSFTVASAEPPPQGSLPPSATPSAPLTSGAPGGTGAGQGGTANGATGNGNRLSACYDAVWAQAVTNRIGKFFIYPRSERDRHVSGAVFVHIGVRRNGRLAFLKVNRSSGVRALDEAALEMVRKAAPLPRIPDRMHLDRVDVELPVVFGNVDEKLSPSPGDCEPGKNVIFHRDT